MSARVTLKLATSLDGRIATADGESRWITGPEARAEAHRLRSRHQAVLVGVETVLADDPGLDVRLDGYTGPQPARVILDSRQRTPPDCKLAANARDLPTFVIATGAPCGHLTDAGVVVLRVAERDGRADPAAALEALAARGIGSVMIEGGGQVAASFLAAGLVDALEWFRAPILLGDQGRPAVGDLALASLAAAPRFRRIAVETVGEDVWERYERV